MAFRRGFKRPFRRFGGKPVMRERPVWTTNNFNETAMTRDGVINEFAILDVSVETPTLAAGPTEVHGLRRVIIHGGLATQVAITTAASDIIALFGALYVIDREETEASIVTTDRGTILEGGAGRVLWTNCWTWASTEHTTVATEAIQEPRRIDIDLKVRLNLRFDQQLILGLQFGSDVTETLVSAAFSAITRTLTVNRR